MTSSYDWDNRNQVGVKRLDDIGQIAGKAEAPYEFWAPSPTKGDLSVVGLYHPIKSRTLIVSFHGSLARSKYELPRFEWRKSLGSIQAGRLYFSDSSLFQSKSIPLAWYVGNSAQDLAADIAETIKVVAETAGYSNVLITGSSGGGFASLAISRKIPGSVSVCFSPQTRIGDYYRNTVGTFRNVCFPDFKSYEDVEIKHPERVNLRHLYATTPDVNYVRYVQNTNDKAHFAKHYTPFAEAFGVDPLLGGFDATCRYRFVPLAMQTGHEPPSRRQFRAHIGAAHEDFFGEELTISNANGRQ